MDHPIKKHFMAATLLRRVAFVLILLLLGDFPELQWGALFAHSVASLIYQCNSQPFTWYGFNLVFVVNEFFICCMVLLSVVFINPIFNNEDAIFVGWIWISLFMLTTIINIGFVLSQYKHNKDLSLEEKLKKKSEELQDNQLNTSTQDQIGSGSNGKMAKK